MKNRKLQIRLLVVVTAILLSFGYKKYREYALIRNSIYGPNWNAERVKRGMPLIEGDMRPSKHFTNLTHNWETENNPTVDQKLVHKGKTILVSDGRSFQEIDAYRLYRNDTVSYQLNITSEILPDSALTSGKLGWTYASDKLGDTPFQELTNLQLDSVKEMWGIK